MAEKRLKLVWKETEPQYAEDSPLVLLACALYQDESIAKSVAQIKWQNIGDQTIASVMIELTCFDAFGTICDKTEYRYDDLEVAPGNFYGDKNGIGIKKDGVDHFEVILKGVAYEDGNVWEGNDNKVFASLSQNPRFSAVRQRVEQYEIEKERKQEALRLREQEISEQKAIEAQQAKEAKQKEKEKKKKKALMICAATLITIGVCVAAFFIVTKVIIPKGHYSKGMQLASAGDWVEAANELDAAGDLEKYEAAGDYSLIQQSYYNRALKALNENDLFLAKISFMKARGYQDSWEKIREVSRTIDQKYTNKIAAGPLFTLGLSEKGSIYSTGDNNYKQLNLSGSGIIAIDCGSDWSLGVKADGTVVSAGYNGVDEITNICNVKGWTDIIEARGGGLHTIGLKSNGTVIGTGYKKHGQCDLGDWRNIIAIAAGSHHSVGLRADGTVVAKGENDYGQCDTSSWTSIIAIAAGNYCTVGLKSDGTVVVAGKYMQDLDYKEWRDIVGIDASHYIIVGLKADGTVVKCIDRDQKIKQTDDWKNIVAVKAGEGHIIALTKDGYVLAAGKDTFDQCDTDGWRLFK